MLNAVGIGRQSLYKAVIGLGKRALLLRDKVFNINLPRNIGNVGAAVVREFITEIQRLCLNYIEYSFVACKNFLTFLNKCKFFFKIV